LIAIIITSFITSSVVIPLGLIYCRWVERHNAEVRKIVEKKKAGSPLCKSCLEYQTCYSLCDRYRLWEKRNNE
jgi:hypothetical protein